MQSVVEDERGVGVLEAVEVPVGVRGQHNWGLLRGGDGSHAYVPLVRSQGVGHVGDDLAGETLLAVLVDEGEGDAVGGVRDYGPVAPVPAVLCQSC